MVRFVAIDFETADNGRDSACAVGLVKVEDNEVVAEAYHLIRPPRSDMMFEYIHGISWDDVKNERSFGEVWPEIESFISDADFLAAHNAPFDRGVLNACCETNSLDVPQKPFVCTVQLARRVWDIRPTKLPNVCTHLEIPLKHHDAASDSLACAQIIIRAYKAGADVTFSAVGVTHRKKTSVRKPKSEIEVHVEARSTRTARVQIVRDEPAIDQGEPEPLKKKPDQFPVLLWVGIVIIVIIIWRSL